MELGTTNINTLKSLMTEYLHHLESCVNECYPKPNRAAKLKRCMKDTLLLFHMFYSDMKKPLEHSSYLDKMSDLMAIYMDMEIKASRRGKESLPKIASKLTSSLYIFLDHSQDHILDSILKTKYMNKNSWELCVLVFARVLRDSPGRAVYEMTYVRYIMVFKMWKRVVRGPEEKRKVMKLATVKLFPPSQFREKLKAGLLSGVLPKIPKSRKDITMFLMQAKFCVKEKIMAFLKVVADPEQQYILGSQLAADLDRPLFFDDDKTSFNLFSDEQEDTNGSCALINDIWLSMTSELDISNLEALSDFDAEMMVEVKNEAQMTVIKSEGIALPVFKTDPGLTDDSDACEELEEKKKHLLPQLEKQPEESKVKLDINVSENADTFEKSSEVVEVKNVPPEPVAVEKKVEIEVCSSEDTDKPNDIPAKPNTQVAIIEKIIGEVEPPKFTNEVSVSSMMVETELDNICIMGFDNSKDKEQVNQVDGVCQGDKENEILEVVEEVENCCDSDNVVAPAPELLCQQAVVSSVIDENSAIPAENAESQSSHVRDVFLYDQQTPAEWNAVHPQGYYNNTVDLIGEHYVNNKLPELNTDSAANDLQQHNIYEIFDMTKSLNARPKENSSPMREDDVLGDLSSVPIEDEASDSNKDLAFASHSASGSGGETVNQPQVPPKEGTEISLFQLEKQWELLDMIEDCLESLHNQGHGSNKRQGKKNQNATAGVSNVIANDQTESMKKCMLQDRALQRVHSIPMSQHKFPSFYITQNILPATPVHSSAVFDQNPLSSVPGCHCSPCYANRIAHITNNHALTQYQNSIINSHATLRKFQNDELLKKIEESLKEKVIKDESLPLKKRKVFTHNPQKKEVELSYPCTPMISIAALEENKINIKTMNYEAKIPTAATTEPMDYSIANTSTYPGYSRGLATGQAAIKPYNTVVIQNSKQKPIVNNIVSGSHTPFLPRNFHTDKIGFQTPAQLNEGSSQYRPAPEITPAHNLTNFAHNSHWYYNTQPNVFEPKPSKHKQRSKSDRQSKKKRQN